MTSRAAEGFLRRLALGFALILLGVSGARGQERQSNEPGASPSPPARTQPAVSRGASEADIPALVVRAMPSPPTRAPAHPSDILGRSQTGGGPGAPAGAAAKPPKYFPYTVRPGDSLGAIARYFGIPIAELARVNRLNEDDELLAGETLKIPNPFEAEDEALKIRLKALTAEADKTRRSLERAKAEVISLTGRNAGLASENSALTEAARMLPWWRGTALSAAAAALLMLGVTLLTLFEWWRLRGRFVALSELAQSLNRLDIRYKEMLAKAELRMQQLYGRRRPASEENEPHPGKSPEEMEIERLDRELKRTLETYLGRLGVKTGARRRSRWREALGGEEEAPVEAGSLRR